MQVGCKKDFLDKQPLSSLAPETFFHTESDLRLYTNSFYSVMPTAEEIYYESEGCADNTAVTTMTVAVRGARVVPTSGGGWTWTELRKINFFLDNSFRAENEDVRKRYEGVARFFRALFYAKMVQRFGDVPWYSHALDAKDEEGLLRPRDSRVLISDSIMADLDFAVAHLPATKSIDQVTKWTALALKSRFGLFEGTFRKYHTEFNLPGYEKLLEACADASKALMMAGVYAVYTSTPSKAYQELFAFENANPTEIILARVYDASLSVFHDVNFHTLSASYGRPGMTKSLVNSYLMSDGTRFTDISRYDTLQFYEETRNRDPRLAQTIRTPGYTRMGETRPVLPQLSNSITGYQIAKYVTEPTKDAANRCSNDMPVFRYAEVLLNYAEAKAELGILTQEDIDISIKLLRNRVGMPNMNLASANAAPDPYVGNEYKNANGANRGVILEIRRERRIELYRENFRFNDLMRWKEGHLLAAPFKGMYFPRLGNYDLDHDGTIDLVLYQGTKPTMPNPQPQFVMYGDIELQNGAQGGNIITNPLIDKKFVEAKDYLFPLPTQELLINPGLKQNPGW
ncbi:MAG: RagB/SusD family nutrient uptake outer membrane protein [Sphingobacteriales bacterium 44-61]|nr:MAG: RagB/SusD family nutrient uptake outer membrane protein [Sphingobacteriales bacterium 44-61]